MSEVRKAKTGFTILKDSQGFFQVIEVGEPVELETAPSLADIKFACGEVRDALLRNEAVGQVLAILSKNNQNNGESEDLAASDEDTSAPEAQ